MEPNLSESKPTRRDSLRDFREKIILKEMETSRETVKNLDDIIYKTKNFAFLAWGGGLALLIKYLSDLKEPGGKHLLVLLTGLIPIIFWLMDYWWRKHLRMVSSRERRLSLFINSEELEQQLNGAPMSDKFPFDDHIGWIYTKQKLKENEIPSGYAEKYLSDEKEFGVWSILFYKDAWIYYLGMMMISVLFWGIAFKP